MKEKQESHKKLAHANIEKMGKDKNEVINVLDNFKIAHVDNRMRNEQKKTSCKRNIIGKENKGKYKGSRKHQKHVYDEAL